MMLILYIIIDNMFVLLHFLCCIYQAIAYYKTNFQGSLPKRASPKKFEISERSAIE